MWRRQLLIAAILWIVFLLVATVLQFQRDETWWLPLLTAIGVGLFFAYTEQRVMRPLRRLQRTLYRLQAGDQSARIWVDEGSDIDGLIRAFSLWQEQQTQRHTELQTAHDRLTTVFRQMIDGVIIVDKHSIVQDVNQAAHDMFAYRDEGVIGRTFAQVVRHHEIIELWQRFDKTGEQQSKVVELTFNKLFLQIDILPLANEAEADGCVVIVHDLTSLRHLETVRRDFISNISHELRTPLASMKAVIETLQDGALEDPPAARRFLARAAIEADAMTQMVSELLELTRIESGQVPLQLSEVNPNGLLSSVADRMLAQADRRGVQMVLSATGKLPLVMADAPRIEQVLVNLTQNALKFTLEGGSVTLRAVQTGQYVQFSVKDTGVGMPKHALKRIFERFYKLDRSRNSRGTGLGLAIAKHLVQAHGGEIWATSRENRGSTFFFTLPLASEDPAEAAVKALFEEL